MKMNKPLATVSLAIALLGAGAAMALAAAADLDPAFGVGGTTATPFGPNSEKALAVAIQPDGKIVAAGETFNGFDYDIAVARFNADGILDTSFSGDGKVVITIGTASEWARGVALQPDGKIVLAGEADMGANNDFTLVRLDPNGSLDTTFSDDGKATTAIGGADDGANAVTLLPDGRILAAGYMFNGANNDFAIARYTADGSLDTSFDGDGKMSTSVGTTADKGNAAVLQPDGKVVVAGQSRVAGIDRFGLIRVDSDGSLDPSFDVDGRLTTAIGGVDDLANALTIQPDGKIIAAGYGRNGGDDDFAFARYNADGSLDSGFDGDGKRFVTVVGPSGDYAYGVHVQSNGKILASGNSYGSNYDTSAARLNPDGSLDAEFDGDGVLILSINSDSDSAYASAIQPDGKIVLAGESRIGGAYDFSVVRLIGDPPPTPATPASPATPAATITSPSKSKLPRKKLKRFAGSAGPAGQVAKVEIGLLQVNNKLRKRGYCRWLKSNKAAFRKVRDRTKKCDGPRFLKATGTDSWSFRLKRAPAKGSYKLFVRVTLVDGSAHTTYSAAQGNLRAFRLT